jgi:hypothetical protein
MGTLTPVNREGISALLYHDPHFSKSAAKGKCRFRKSDNVGTTMRGEHKLPYIIARGQIIGFAEE